MSNVNKVMEQVDWEELFEQKMQLVEAISLLEKQVGANAMEDDPMLLALNGLLSLLDSLNDAAEEDSLWESPLGKF